jgi:hypothetical protein
MSHLDVRYCVNGRLTSSDTTLLDQIESALPDENDVILGREYSQNRTTSSEDTDLASGEERLSARMTFAGESTTLDDGSELTPEQAATNLFDTVASDELGQQADNWSLELYRTPEGAIRSEDVQAWYEADATRQPTRAVEQDGQTVEEKYVPSSFDPSHHSVQNQSG